MDRHCLFRHSHARHARHGNASFCFRSPLSLNKLDSLRISITLSIRVIILNHDCPVAVGYRCRYRGLFSLTWWIVIPKNMYITRDTYTYIYIYIHHALHCLVRHGLLQAGAFTSNAFTGT